jgi:sulfopyruvate decarboxylase subunit beta
MRMDEALTPVRAERRDQDVVVTTMAAAKVWMDMGPAHSRDLVFVPSSMSHATSVGLGIALAQPNRRVIVVNGDGSMLMNLGSLVTIAAQEAANLVVIVCDNGVYEVTGSQPVPARVDFEAIARGSGFNATHHFTTAAEWASNAAVVLARRGPVLVVLDVTPDKSRPAPKSPGPAGARAQALRAALV